MHGCLFERPARPLVRILPWISAALACATAGGVATAAPPADARAAFEAAAAEWKDVVAELTVLQAQFQQPRADKVKIAAAFDAAIAKGREIRGRLEVAALEAVAADPGNKRAAQACGEALVEAIEEDDPGKALDLATKLDAAGAADGRTRLVAAAAALLLARLDEAEAWLAKAREAKASDRELAEFRAAIDRDRPKVEAEIEKRAAEAAADDLPRVRIRTSAGDLVVELFENEAPNTVANFVSLVEKGFYDGTPFHRVIGGFMAQGGDPTGTGGGGPGYVIACECGLPDARRHFLGTLSMAHAGADTGGSQFFLTFRPTEHLDGKHTVFGRVVEGLEVLPKLARTQDGTGRSIPGVKQDTIVAAEVVRKRPHPYVPTTRPDPRGR